MSSRRSARAASRSSRAISPARSTATTTTTTPRTRRRAGNEPLPAVGLRTSTAYGTNTTAKAPRPGGPIVSDQIESVLQGILQTTGSQPAQQTPPRASSPASADRSFGLESAIFYGARFESSLPSTPPRSPSNTKSPEPPTAPTGIAAQVDPRDAPTIKALEDLARQRLQKAGVTESGVFQKGWDGIKSIFSFLYSLISSIFSFDVLPYLTVALVIFLAYQFAVSDFDLKSKIGDYFPAPGSPGNGPAPSHWFTHEHHNSIINRLKALEKDVGSLKTKMGTMDKTLEELVSDILPDHLVLKKDSDGKMLIPDEFWTALQDKIRADDTLLKERIGKPVEIGKGKGTVDPKELKKEVEKIAKTTWDRYMKNNERNLANLLDDELKAKFPGLLKTHKIATKDEVLELIRDNWSENSEGLQEAFKQMDRKIGANLKAIGQLQKGSGGMTKSQVKDIASDVLKKLIPHAQLEALTKAMLNGATKQSLGRLNHFSLAAGAIVDPVITSPTYIFPNNDLWFTSRWARAAIGNPVPAPLPPRAALSRWEEYGDCWCAPSTNILGFGPSIGVITANDISPDQIVIEHIPKAATPEPNAAPKEMELVAYLGDLDIYNQVKSISNDLFENQVEELEHPYRYVRIATWTYNIDGDSAQSFPVQVDLGALGFGTNKFIVRAKNNWGTAEKAVPYTCLYRIKVHGEVVSGSGATPEHVSEDISEDEVV